MKAVFGVEATVDQIRNGERVYGVVLGRVSVVVILVAVGHHRIDQFDLRFLLQKPTGQFKQVVVGSTADS